MPNIYDVIWLEEVLYHNLSTTMLGKKIMTEAQSIYKKKYFVSTFNKVANIFLEKTPEINCDGSPYLLTLNTPKRMRISCFPPMTPPTFIK